MKRLVFFFLVAMAFAAPAFSQCGPFDPDNPCYDPGPGDGGGDLNGCYFCQAVHNPDGTHSNQVECATLRYSSTNGGVALEGWTGCYVNNVPVGPGFCWAEGRQCLGYAADHRGAGFDPSYDFKSKALVDFIRTRPGVKAEQLVDLANAIHASTTGLAPADAAKAQYEVCRDFAERLTGVKIHDGAYPVPAVRPTRSTDKIALK